MTRQHGDVRVKLPPKLVYAAVAVAVSLIATATAFVVVSARAEQRAQLAEQVARDAVHQSEQRLCRLIIVLDDRFRADPPSEPVRQEMADTIAELRDLYGCPLPG